MMIKILFACVGNSCRSQMAEGFCRALGSDVECASAGTQPEEAVSVEAIRVMQEVGIDISKAKPKSFGDLPDLKFDYLVTMGCEVECPYIPGVKRIEWNIPDPKGKSLDEFRRVREIIRQEVVKLFADIGRLREKR
ncbi:arsenate reductase ArsC [candidate division WOR-3 bacterium]|nr:arsenate reductase ArsC [candidate division WOR-3 bacterium]